MPNIYDKFYTKPEVAKECVDFLFSHYPELKNEKFIEPSAGSGSFLKWLISYEAYDIKPEGENIVKQDFIKFSYKNNTSKYAIGNPPFGHRSSLAIDFFNKCAEWCNIIAFIVPVSFMKWNVQKNLSNNFKLTYWKYLEPNSFTENNNEYSIRTVFQIWERNSYSNNLDHRLLKQPPIKHADFNIWQYNATPHAFKVIDENWEYALYRQGYYNYNQIFNRTQYEEVKEQMKQGRQFFFIEPLTEKSKEIILRMDFNSLAERNTSTPGFGKGDFVSYYTEITESQ